MVIAIDLDGTLLDVKHKYHAVYSCIVKEHGAVPLDLDVFWGMKRNGVPNKKMLSESRCSLDWNIYRERFAERIEAPVYLNLDRLMTGTDEFLEWIAHPAEPVLVTLRKNAKTLSEQLERLRINRYFKKIICDTTEGIEPAWRKKEYLFKTNLEGQNGIVIGDSEADIKAGRSVGFETMALSSGIRTEEMLAPYHPDHLFPDIRSLLSHFMNKGVMK